MRSRATVADIAPPSLPAEIASQAPLETEKCRATAMESRVRSLWTLSLCLPLAGVVLAQRAYGVDESRSVPPIPVSAADLKWLDLDPTGAPGVKVAELWGDHKAGSFGAFFRLPAGFSAPLHTHTHEMRLVIVSGTYIQGPDGKEEFRLGPGSYLMQPGGNYRHTTRCDPASECVFFVEGAGAFDLRSAAN
jgi:quercetin dioxygenase-like cupin family protein